MVALVGVCTTSLSAAAATPSQCSPGGAGGASIRTLLSDARARQQICVIASQWELLPAGAVHEAPKSASPAPAAQPTPTVSAPPAPRARVQHRPQKAHHRRPAKQNIEKRVVGVPAALPPEQVAFPARLLITALLALSLCFLGAGALPRSALPWSAVAAAVTERRLSLIFFGAALLGAACILILVTASGH